MSRQTAEKNAKSIGGEQALVQRALSTECMRLSMSQSERRVWKS